MWTWKKAGWWLWLGITVLLGAYLAGQAWAIYPLLGLLAVQTGGYIRRDRSLITFPVQVRGMYLAIFLIGVLVPGFGWLLWVQLAGTVVFVAFDYCPLARVLVLMPWNRAVPLSWEVARVALLSPPDTECIVHVISGVGAPAVSTLTPEKEAV